MLTCSFNRYVLISGVLITGFHCTINNYQFFLLWHSLFNLISIFHKICHDREYFVIDSIQMMFIMTSPSVSVASRRITLLQRPLRDLCSLVFGATRIKENTKNIIFEISMLDYSIWSLESS